MFRSMVLAALAIALVAGLVLSAVQALHVSPIIYAAEVFEIAQPEVTAAFHDGHSHTHNDDAWAPTDGFERVGFTILSNVLSAFGFAMVLLACMFVARDKAELTISWLNGIFWGLAGYLTFFVVPALGLSPEIPSMEAAAIEGRQSWWFLAVMATGLAIASLIFLPGITKVCSTGIYCCTLDCGCAPPRNDWLFAPRCTSCGNLRRPAIAIYLCHSAGQWLILDRLG